MSENPTQPTLKTVLEAVNDIGVGLHKLQADFDEFRVEVNKRFERLEAKMDARFNVVEESINVIAGDMVRMRARDSYGELLKERAKELEDKPDKKRA